MPWSVIVSPSLVKPVALWTNSASIRSWAEDPRFTVLPRVLSPFVPETSCRTGESAASRIRACAGALEGTDRLLDLDPRLRGFDEAELLGDGDRLAPARDAELAVDGDRLGLDRVPRDVEALAHLPEGQVGGEKREQAQLRACEAGARAVARLGHRSDLELE